MLCKTKIKIGLPTFIFFGIILFSNANPIVFIPFLCAILHEFGHILAMIYCKDTITSITILPFGIDIKKKERLSSYKEDIIVTVSGILVNIICLLIYCFLPKSPATHFFALSNALLIVINILPIKSLDGGQLLEKILLLKLDDYTAGKILFSTSFVCLLLLLSVAVWLLFSTSYNFTLLIMCIYLFCGIFVK